MINDNIEYIHVILIGHEFSIEYFSIDIFGLKPIQALLNLYYMLDMLMIITLYLISYSFLPIISDNNNNKNY
ncbi:hypothetical protein DERP_012002 [Dermatophagoides pteronyssinus]|uniref:Uncharacterized protein n=1 Tax=Dermatophagoides pteronyssinus TaxID=6956 RepID=A0ABQ8IVM1_DERPT|nr:hypothetical protein DERP_012002 [Dermatophagoides pteronyssinus]